ncbi:MAG: YigZ family protein [Bacteroidales bacterium]|nr:YigZ family protein [Bacteroidales bacterium]MDD5975908.1 YigZ family protein [Bacteroidales bacterium]MDY5193763.1 YigZ family protein [Candidatus Aphodosoma sp.]
MDTFLTVKDTATAIFKDKGSKFIAFIYPVSTIDEIKSILDQKRKEYYDARHVCYAYMLGFERLNFRANDDGEPSGTAGRPILGQINSANLTDVLIIVVRYFGGILLGTSGLINAYKTSACDVINSAEIITKIVEKSFVATCDYQTVNDVMKIIKEYNLELVKSEYNLDCSFTFKVRTSLIDTVSRKFSNLDFVQFNQLDDE